MTVYLALTGEASGSAKSCGAPPVHMIYAIDGRGVLTRSAKRSGGLMGLFDRCGGMLRDRDALVRAIVRECAARGFRGVLADFAADSPPDRRPFLDALGAALSRSARTLYVPAALEAPHARLLVGTAVSGGSLREHLSDAVRTYGAGRLALDLQRLRMDFTVPSFSAVGRPLTAGEFDRLRSESGAGVFYSDALAARYFTYRTGSETHFVLFDDARTLRTKLRLAEELGIGEAFLMYPEVPDLIGELFRSG